MAHYYSKFPKRHIGWSNSKTIGKLDLGTLSRDLVKLLSKLEMKSAKTYLSKGGRKRFVGSRHLKSTQPDS